MARTHAKWFVPVLFIAAVNVGHAAIIQYDVSGTMNLADTNWNSITSHEISGYMYISDVDLLPDVDGVWFEIDSFVIRAGGYEWAGVGRISGYTDRFLNLDGPGNWEISTGLVPSQGGWDWDSPDQLPAAMSWPGDAWHFGEEIFSRVASLDLHAVQTVPIPAATWLLFSGLVGLAGFARRCISGKSVGLQLNIKAT